MQLTSFEWTSFRFLKFLVNEKIVILQKLSNCELLFYIIKGVKERERDIERRQIGSTNYSPFEFIQSWWFLEKKGTWNKPFERFTDKRLSSIYTEMRMCKENFRKHKERCLLKHLKLKELQRNENLFTNIESTTWKKKLKKKAEAGAKNQLQNTHKDLFTQNAFSWISITMKLRIESINEKVEGVRDG